MHAAGGCRSVSPPGPAVCTVWPPFHTQEHTGPTHTHTQLITWILISRRQKPAKGIVHTPLAHLSASPHPCERPSTWRTCPCSSIYHLTYRHITPLTPGPLPATTVFLLSFITKILEKVVHTYCLHSSLIQ